MHSKRILFSLLVGLLGGKAMAQDSSAVKKSEGAKLKSFAEVIPAKAISSKGLFTVHKVDDKYFFEIPDSLLQREFLFTTRLVKVPVGSPMYGGELVNSIIVSFEKASEEKLYLRVVTNVAVADSNNAIAKAVRNSTIDPVVMVLDVKARNKDRKSSVLDITDFILKDNNITGFDASSRKVMMLGGAAADRCLILSVNAFPQNLEMKTMKTFSVGAGGPSATPGAPAAEASANVGVTMELSTSVMLMPEMPMQARHYDPRVGYYSENYKVFADNQQKVEEKNFIVRQRLEPKPEDLERYKRGELVEPKEPLVYYVDPATPKQWRPYIIAGINDWNEAFKAAGFKNAIIGKEWPENDSTMSIEDVRCKVVRYFPSGQAFSYAPRIYDPRSGEIMQTYIGWSHSKMQTLHDIYFVQAAAADSRARSMKFSTELMGSLIRAEISREVGHSLGLRNNLAGNTSVPVEKLRDKKWVEANGISASIMDYVFYNYVAQPEDNVSPKGLVPQIGEYDKWAIKYGYTYTDNKDFDADKRRVQQLITQAASAPAVKYSPEGSVNDPLDPKAQTLDLGNDHIKASEYGIKNLKIVTANLLKWTKEDLDFYDNTAAMYENVCNWYGALVRHVYSEIGGVNENLKSVEQTGDIFTPVSRDMQKRAVAFLQKEVFQTPTWLFDQEMLNKFRKPVKKEMWQKWQDQALFYTMSPDRLYRMNIETMRYGKDKTYTIDELLTDITKGIFSEVKSTQPAVVDFNRRYMQKLCVDNLIRILQYSAKAPEPGSSSPDMSVTDMPVVARVQLDNIKKQCKAAIPACKDPMTQAHLNYVVDKISRTLNPKG